MNYVAFFNLTVQTSPEDFEVYPQVRQLTADTTIKDIQQWHDEIVKASLPSADFNDQDLPMRKIIIVPIELAQESLIIQPNKIMQ